MSKRHYAKSAVIAVVNEGRKWTKEELRREFALGSSTDASVAKCFSDWSAVYNLAHTSGWTSTLKGGKPVRDPLASKLTEKQRAKMSLFIDAADKLAELFGGSKEKGGRGAKPFDMLSMFDDDDETADDETADE